MIIVGIIIVIITFFCCLGFYRVYKKRRNTNSTIERGHSEPLNSSERGRPQQVPEVTTKSESDKLKERENERLQQETEERSKCVAM